MYLPLGGGTLIPIGKSYEFPTFKFTKIKVSATKNKSLMASKSGLLRIKFIGSVNCVKNIIVNSLGVRVQCKYFISYYTDTEQWNSASFSNAYYIIEN